jgi:hypothetical protein
VGSAPLPEAVDAADAEGALDVVADTLEDEDEAALLRPTDTDDAPIPPGAGAESRTARETRRMDSNASAVSQTPMLLPCTQPYCAFGSTLTESKYAATLAAA